MDKLNLFFAKIKELSFIQRIFSWRTIRSLSYDAFDEFKSLNDKINQQDFSKDEANTKITQLGTENSGLKERVIDIEKREIKNEAQIEVLNKSNSNLNTEKLELEKKVSGYEKEKESRDSNYENKIAQLNEVKTNLENERKRLSDERINEKEEYFQNMKVLWQEHETSVKQKIKNICERNYIKYLDEVPFKGKPDNTLEICDEYIIFDAKSPSNDDLTNFPKYITVQTESVKKYAKIEGVKKEIFLVIPTNTISQIKKLTYKMADYNVYVVTEDALEPIILSLKKIEEYDFAEQLSPDERDNICRVIGKFAHTTKRKIQIDQFFSDQFIELLEKCKKDLPKEILEQVIELEKQEKLNPPTEKRTKQILTSDLKKKNVSINAEAKIRKIDIPQNFDDIKKLE